MNNKSSKFKIQNSKLINRSPKSITHNPKLIQNWYAPPQDLHLQENLVDIWLVSLELKETTLDKLLNILSEEERENAQRLYSPALKNNYIAARGLLRLMIARYLATYPEELTFQYNRYGKPSLSGKFEKTIYFNNSHSHGMGLYGITMKRAIGVDIEKIRANIQIEKLAKRQFTTSEFKRFKELPENEKLQAFFTCWTRKESVGKAIGKGMLFHMAKFDVSNTPHEPVKFLSDPGDNESMSAWFNYDLDIGNGFCGAFSLEGQHKITNLYRACIENLL